MNWGIERKGLGIVLYPGDVLPVETMQGRLVDRTSSKVAALRLLFCKFLWSLVKESIWIVQIGDVFFFFFFFHFCNRAILQLKRRGNLLLRDCEGAWMLKCTAAADESRARCLALRERLECIQTRSDSMQRQERADASWQDKYLATDSP